MNPGNALNFSGGPGALPTSVLAQLAAAMNNVPEVGLSILGISHRSDWFAAIVGELEDNIRLLLGIGKNYHILFLQGGATQQFSMIPMLLLRGRSKTADYLHTGHWSGKAIPEARREGAVRVLWSGEGDNYSRLPSDEELACSPDAAYLHYVSNETVEGLQFGRVLGHDAVPRVCDMSSDFLSQPCAAERFSLIYAHAQKNLGPAGVTVVLLRNELLAEAPDNLPACLDYRPPVAAHSTHNTPPVFAIYATLLVSRWLRDEIGGLENMAAINRRKAASVYTAIDASDGFYRGRAALGDRSLMNVAFDLATPELSRRFLAAAEAAGFSGLNGHRAAGGLRASLYNAVGIAACERLAEFMDDFRRAC